MIERRITDCAALVLGRPRQEKQKKLKACGFANVLRVITNQRQNNGEIIPRMIFQTLRERISHRNKK